MRTHVVLALLLLGWGIVGVYVAIYWIDHWTGKGLIAIGALLAGMGAVLSGVAAVRTARKNNKEEP